MSYYNSSSIVPGQGGIPTPNSNLSENSSFSKKLNLGGRVPILVKFWDKPVTYE